MAKNALETSCGEGDYTICLACVCIWAVVIALLVVDGACISWAPVRDSSLQERMVSALSPISSMDNKMFCIKWGGVNNVFIVVVSVFDG
jgi:hypothetical protein